MMLCDFSSRHAELSQARYRVYDLGTCSLKVLTVLCNTRFEKQDFLGGGGGGGGYRGVVHPPSDDEGTERTWKSKTLNI